MWVIRNILLMIIVCMVSLVSSIACCEEFGGLGIVVARLYDTSSTNNMGNIVVLHVSQTSEAKKVGIMAGDIISEIDGKPTAGRIFEDIVLNSLRGEIGSFSDIKIKRFQEEKILTFRIKRTLVTSPEPAN